MGQRDFYSNVRVAAGFKPAAVGAGAIGAILSLRGVRRVIYVIACGVLNGTAGVKLQHSDDGVTFVDVPAAQFQSDIPLATMVDGGAYRLGYLGNAAFLRPVFTGAATGINASVTAVIDPVSKPVA